jgi:hypothetical protein
MTYLKFYDVEKERFSTAQNVTLEFPLAQRIVKKLARHFKVTNFSGVRKQTTRWCGHAYSDYSISIPKKATLLLICHEVAHLYNKQYLGDWSHSKKLMRTLKRIVHYALKMLPLWVGNSRVVSLLYTSNRPQEAKIE